MRKFDTGATRDAVEDKLDYEAFLSVPVVAAFARYMHGKRDTPLGRRDGDNWQKGMPKAVYMKSAWRHFFDLWALHRGHAAPSGADVEEAICALLFNLQGYLHEHLKGN